MLSIYQEISRHCFGDLWYKDIHILYDFIFFQGIGTGAGWVYPISFLLQTKMMQVSECNAVVKTVTDFFSQLCLPGALNSFYNPFGMCISISLFVKQV